MAQKQVSAQQSTQREPEVQEERTASTRDETLADDVDAILDEIDEVLETNAAEFVKGFVQKGGQ